MSTRKPMDTSVKVAWIAAGATILAAIIGGMFGLIKLFPPNPPTPTQQPPIVNIGGNYSGNPPTPTQQPPIVNIGGNYSGTMDNTTFNLSAPMTLVIQQNQNNIGGNLTVYSPLAPGSGPITSGSANANSAGYVSVQFTVQFTIQSGVTGACGRVCTFDFQGHQNPDRSLQGSYRIEQSGESGTWVVSHS